MEMEFMLHNNKSDVKKSLILDETFFIENTRRDLDIVQRKGDLERSEQNVRMDISCMRFIILMTMYIFLVILKCSISRPIYMV